MSIKGFSSQQKKSSNEFVTVQNLGGGKFGLDMIQRVAYQTTAIPFTIASVDESSPYSVLHITSHGITDSSNFIRFSTGNNKGVEVYVLEVIDADTVKLSQSLEELPVIGDELYVMKPISLTVDENGALTTSDGPLKFIKDAVSVEVTKDTVDSNNTIGLPVEIVGADGTAINITAGDINVQLDHTGANYDSTRIGDGTNLLGINASLEALVHDADALTELQAILAKIIASPATEAKQDTVITALGSLLTELQLKSDLTETQPVSLASQPLPTGAATEVKQDSIITELQSLNTEVASLNDVFDTEFLDTSSTNIPSNVSSPLEIVASASQDIKKIQSLDTTGAYIGLYTGASGSEVLKYIIGPGSDTTIDVNIASGTRLSIKNMENSAISVGILALNYIG